MTPLRQRYIDDLRLKNFSLRNDQGLRSCRGQVCQALWTFARRVEQEDVRAYLVHLIERGLARSTCVVVRNALRHLFTDTLGRPDCVEKLPRPKRERSSPWSLVARKCGDCSPP